MTNPVILYGIAVILLFSGLLMTWYGSSKDDPTGLLKYIFRRSIWIRNKRLSVFAGIVFIIISLVILFSS
jgi:hypothetical protein